jgi:hypothetical protein
VILASPTSLEPVKAVADHRALEHLAGRASPDGDCMAETEGARLEGVDAVLFRRLKAGRDEPFRIFLRLGDRWYQALTLADGDVSSVRGKMKRYGPTQAQIEAKERREAAEREFREAQAKHERAMREWR